MTTLAEAMGDGMDITSFLATNANVGVFKIAEETNPATYIDDEQMRRAAINSTNIVPFSPRVNVDATGHQASGTTRASHVVDSSGFEYMVLSAG